MKPLWPRLLVSTVTVLLCIVALEWTLRVLTYGSLLPLESERALRIPHPTRGWTLRAGARAHQRNLDFDVTVAINDQGQRDRPHDLEKAPGCFRIVVLGDSFMEAYQVDLEESLPYRLQETLADRSVEVVNLGVGGYGTAQELRMLEEVGVAYAPDLVLLAFYAGNDVQNNARSLEAGIGGEDDPKTWGRPYASADGPDAPLVWTEPDIERLRAAEAEAQAQRASTLRRAWKLVEPALLVTRGKQLLAGVGARLGLLRAKSRAHFGQAFLAEHDGPDWDAGWRVTLRLILAMRDTSRAAGARFAVLLVPAKLQVEPDFREHVRALYPGTVFDETRINRELERFAAAHDIPLLDPTPDLVARTASGSRVYHQMDDRHWNALGHAVATERVAAFLEASGWLPADRGLAPDARRAGQPGSSSDR